MRVFRNPGHTISSFLAPIPQKPNNTDWRRNEDFVIDRIVLNDMMESLLGLDEVAVPKKIDLVNDMDQDWIDDRSKPEVEFEPELEQTHE